MIDPTTAQTILQTIAGIALVLWLAGCWFVASSRDAAAEEASSGDWGTIGRRRPSLQGSMNIEGEPNELARKAAVLVARGALGPVKILEAKDSYLEFEGVPIRRVGWVALDFGSGGAHRTQVTYVASPRTGTALLTIAKILLIVGLAAVVVGFALLQRFAVNSPRPAIRGQVFQMIQVIHFLWPPWLLAGLHRAMRRNARMAVEAFVSNLPFVTGE